jgi:hypothetical protein
MHALCIISVAGGVGNPAGFAEWVLWAHHRAPCHRRSIQRGMTSVCENAHKNSWTVRMSCCCDRHNVIQSLFSLHYPHPQDHAAYIQLRTTWHTLEPSSDVPRWQRVRASTMQDCTDRFLKQPHVSRTGCRTKDCKAMCITTPHSFNLPGCLYILWDSETDSCSLTAPSSIQGYDLCGQVHTQRHAHTHTQHRTHAHTHTQRRSRKRCPAGAVHVRARVPDLDLHRKVVVV